MLALNFRDFREFWKTRKLNARKNFSTQKCVSKYCITKNDASDQQTINAAKFVNHKSAIFLCNEHFAFYNIVKEELGVLLRNITQIRYFTILCQISGSNKKQELF